MSTPLLLNVSQLLGHKLKQTQHALRLQMDEALKNLNLTTPQYAVLAQLELKPNISNAELARSAFITAQTMHGIVSNLEKRKWVKRKNDPDHGRILCTELTKEGKRLVQQAHHFISQIEHQMTSTLSKSDKALLEKMLLECFDNLNNAKNRKSS